MRLNHALLALMMGPTLISASPPLFDSPALSDAELAQARGGFELPGGIKVDFGVIMRTTMNGTTILETTLRTIGDTVQASVQTAVGGQIAVAGKTVAYAGNGEASASAGGTSAQASAPGGIGQTAATAGSTSAQAAQGTGGLATVGDAAVQAAPGGASATAGTVVAGGSQVGGLTVTVGDLHATANQDSAQISAPTISASASTNGSGTLTLAGTAPAPLSKAVEVATKAAAQNPGTPPAAPATTANTAAKAPSTVVATTDIGLSATTQMDQLLVRHDIGRQISSLIVNTGNDRAIDSQLLINLHLDNAQPLSLGSAGFRVQSLGLDAAIWRATGG
ncbi:MAG: hypothetical protein BGP16_09820 [Sphingobium sp. 66-54]|nr:MAG: hypothetical protein BGP16_09820 [Sphingobium sp. 66-54]